jgi:hypothetical protein
MKSSDRRATAELLIATIEAAITRGCRHKGELLATTLAVLECLQREGFVTVRSQGPPKPCPTGARARSIQLLSHSAGSPLAPGPLAFPVDHRPCMERPARTRRRFRLAAGVVNVEPAAADSAAPDTAADAGAKSAKSAQRKSAMDAYAAQTGREQKLRGRKSRR